MGMFGDFDRGFASPADYEDGFVESDAARSEREAREAAARRRAMPFDLTRPAPRREAVPPGQAEATQRMLDGKNAPSVPSPGEWRREKAEEAGRYFGLLPDEMDAAGMAPDGTPYGSGPAADLLARADMMEADGDDGMEYGEE